MARPSNFDPNAPICPHSIRRVRVEQIPLPLGSNSREGCTVCHEDWGTVYDGIATRPRLLRHCDHAICETCFVSWRTHSIGCHWTPCRNLRGSAPLNLAGCQDCHNWATRFEAQNQKFVIIALPEILWLIADEIKMLGDDDSYFQIPPHQMKQLTREWRTQLKDYRSQYYRWDDLAEILDPFRGADLDPNEVIRDYGNLLGNLPSTMVSLQTRGYVAPDPTIAIDFPYGIEPWLSTVIRHVLHELSRREGFWAQYEEVGGIGVSDPDRPREGTLRNTEYLGYVKRIDTHRVGADGHRRYRVQYVGYTLRGEGTWLSRCDIYEPIVQRYNAARGLPDSDYDDDDEDDEEDEDEMMTDVD